LYATTEVAISSDAWSSVLHIRVRFGFLGARYVHAGFHSAEVESGQEITGPMA